MDPSRCRSVLQVGRRMIWFWLFYRTGRSNGPLIMSLSGSLHLLHPVNGIYRSLLGSPTSWHIILSIRRMYRTDQFHRSEMGRQDSNGIVNEGPKPLGTFRTPESPVSDTSPRILRDEYSESLSPLIFTAITHVGFLGLHVPLKRQWYPPRLVGL
jgi:hypothetical protein